MSTTTQAGAHPPHARQPDDERRPWTVLGLMLAAQFMVVLDVSVVNVALPSIGADLHLSSAAYQWTVSAYVLLSGGLLLLGGRMADLFDRRRMFLLGLTLFTGASLASGLADSATALVVSRAAQGAGAALLTPAAMSVVMTTYAGQAARRRTRRLGHRRPAWASPPASCSAACSPARSTGVRCSSSTSPSASSSWPAPCAPCRAGRAPAAGSAASTSPAPSPSSAACSPSSTPCSPPPATAGPTPPPWQRRAPQRAAARVRAHRAQVPAPLVPPRIWRVRSLVSASTVMAGVTGAVVGAIFLSSLYLQQVLGSSAVVTGLQFLPLAAAITLSAAVASKLLPHTGPRALIAAGLVVSAAGALLLSHGRRRTRRTPPTCCPASCVMGLGVGPMFVAISVGAMGDVPDHASGLASGLMMTGHEVGAALGVAVLTAVAGDLTTRAGLVAGHADAFVAVAVLLLALLLPTALVPRRAAASAGGHGHGHGH